MTIDFSKVRFLSLVCLKDGESVLSVPYCEMTSDPDLIAGFVTAVIIFAKNPIRTIRKEAYDILIEVGGSYLVLLVVDPVPDETPYRKRIQEILNTMEGDILDNEHNGSDEYSSLLNTVRNFQLGNPHWLQHYALNRVLRDMGLGWVGFLDIDPVPLLTRLTSLLTNQSECDHELVADFVINSLCRQIDSGGTTIGLDIASMMTRGDLASRIHKVLRTRRDEMENLSFYSDGSKVNLEPLWLTAYGNTLLSEMDIGTTCSIREYSEVESNLRDLGFDIQLDIEPPSRNIPIRKELRDFILIARNRLMIDILDKIN